MDRQASRPDRDIRELLHTLNQRYYQQWHRAETLQRELDQLYRWVGPLVRGLRRVKRWLAPATADQGCEGRSYPPLAEAADAGNARVSIVIPFRDQSALLRNCLRSLRPARRRIAEIILVDNASRQPRTLRLLHRLAARRGYRIVRDPAPFNFSRLCNAGARAATGDTLLFLNNDTEALTADFLDRLLRVAAVPRVGVVGGTLLYPDGTIQHAGLHPLADGRWAHSYRGLPFPAAGTPTGTVREVAAVTGACLLVRRDLFAALGGMDESLPFAYNDVEFCCRVRGRGLRVAVTPHARLLHYEGLSRGFSDERPGVGPLAGRAFDAAGPTPDTAMTAR